MAEVEVLQADNPAGNQVAPAGSPVGTLVDKVVAAVWEGAVVGEVVVDTVFEVEEAA